jgi:isoleucyl-tRNA synthetase
VDFYFLRRWQQVAQGKQQQPAKSQIAQIEEQMLKVWADEDTFVRSVENRAKGKHFEFYDGPPFANGLPHYGHVVSSIVKDAIPRYKTMQGYHVPRRFGWDCHGLPAEMKAENDLDLGSKAAIEDYGVDQFVNYCRNSVTEFTKDWEDYIDRIGRWVDFDNNYYTMDDGYIESVMWAFKQLYDKGLVSEGFKVMPYCHVCETALSHFESRLDDNYRERIDPAVTVRFTLESGESLLAWTTTPWTLPANLAVAVNRDLTYHVYEGNGERVVLAPEAVERYASELASYKKVATKQGSEFVGMQYKPPFDYFIGHKNSHVVLHADFVTAEDGTGIAHEAPGFGEDDQVLCEANGIEVVVPVDKQGNYTDEITAFAGMNVFNANAEVIDHLKNQGSLFKEEEYPHNYPHCWRTDNPLIYRGVSTWMVDVPKLKDELIANNQQINWMPQNVKDGAFGKWLEGVRVWNISRDRYWGAPIPIWKTEDGEVMVVGSLKELKERAVDSSKVGDLHKPAIDEVVLRTDSGKEAYRVGDVFDCWFESGSMPFAQHNYPVGADSFQKPADFIVEYVGQIRGWFYTLHVLATALWGEPAFKNAISHGVILGSDSRKMSKKLGNYPDLNHVFDRYGADALRYYLFASPVMVGETVAINEKDILDVQRNVIMTLLNSYRFFKTYAAVDSWQPPEQITEPAATHVLDQWILARLNETIETVTTAVEGYDIPKGVRPLRGFIDDLSNWYIRRSRRRFWKTESDEDKEQAYQTLWYVLIRTAQLSAPWMPFVSDYIYRELRGDQQKLPQSVHETDWPMVDNVDKDTIEHMQIVRDLIVDGLAQRAEAKVKVRQPLGVVDIVANTTLSSEDKGIIAEELNVKSVEVRLGNENTLKVDVEVTTELAQEGMARDLIRHIQNTRKKAGLQVDDRIDLGLSSATKVPAISVHQDMIARETLAESLQAQRIGDALLTQSVTIGDVEIEISLKKH